MTATELRFSRLRERLGGVSQKMLTKTLQQLERNGLVVRRVHAEVPPRVDYRLTALGVSLGKSVCGLWTWVEAHIHDVERSRRTSTLALPRARRPRVRNPLAEAVARAVRAPADARRRT